MSDFRLYAFTRPEYNIQSIVIPLTIRRFLPFKFFCLRKCLCNLKLVNLKFVSERLYSSSEYDISLRNRLESRLKYFHYYKTLNLNLEAHKR